MLFLSKILTTALLPVGQVLGVAFVAAVAALSGRRKLASGLVTFAFLLLWAYSSSYVAGLLVWSLERQYPMQTAAEAPEADLAVVLGGMSGQLRSGGDPQVNDSADRAFHAARLFKAGKVQALLVSGGNMPWDTLQVPEAEVIAALIRELGVPADRITVEPASATTYENAINTAAMLRDKPPQRILLVTSGWHMPRAVATFRAQGIEVMPSPTDARVNRDATFDVFALLPDAGSLALSSLAVREWAGIVVYWLQGRTALATVTSPG